MSGRLAARAADAQALLSRYTEASEHAISAIERGDGHALESALDARDELQRELERVARDIAVLRARFADDRPTPIASAALERLLAPLETLVGRADELQRRLAERAELAAASIAGELARLNAAGSSAYANAAGAGQLDVRL